MSRQGLKRLYGLVSDAGPAARAALGAVARVSCSASGCPRRCRFWRPARARWRRAISASATRCAATTSWAFSTESFNTMTTQLAEARAQLLRNQDQLEAAKAYLESILAKLSAGVLSFDSERRLRSANPSAEQILDVELEPLMGISLGDWGLRDPRLAEIGRAILEAIDQGGSQPWEKQIEFAWPGREEGAAAARIRRCKSVARAVSCWCSTTSPRLLQAQRYAAWGEVARRLAHEIKNPLTPIQLSAERLTHRLADKLSAAGRRHADPRHADHRGPGGAAQGYGGCLQPVRTHAGDPPRSRSTSIGWCAKYSLCTNLTRAGSCWSWTRRLPKVEGDAGTTATGDPQPACRMPSRRWRGEPPTHRGSHAA